MRSAAESIGIDRKKLKKALETEKIESVEDLHKILSALNKTHQFIGFCQVLFPEMANSIIQSFVVNPSKITALDDDLTAYLTDERYHDIMTVCSYDQGLSLIEIKDKFGSFGLKYAKELINAGVLKPRQNKYFCELSGKQSSLETVSQRLKISIDNYDATKRGSQSNALIYRPFKIDQNNLKIVHQKIVELNQTLEIAVSNSKSSAEKQEIHFLGIVLDSFGVN